jgi:endogenous inhibitor of DNA gyrase (YacG/DUF329 family)
MSALTVHCPICRQPVNWDASPQRPFCSERCKGVDLGNWAAEAYRVPGSHVITESSADDENQQH